LQSLPLPYSGDVKLARAVDAKEVALPSWFSQQPLQHPLSVYQQVLEAL